MAEHAKVRLGTLVVLAGALALAACGGPQGDVMGGRPPREGRPPERGGPPEGGGPGGGMPPEVWGAFSPIRAEMGHMKAKGFLETGLKPAYPKEARCFAVNSPFGVTTRGDGSQRTRRFFWGFHGGMDIPAPGGTPILAVAAGKVISKKDDDSSGIGGIGIILQHAPEDTGLPVWTYTEYKHLEKMSPLEVGQRVEMGQVIGHVGNTGTTGGHYGPAGHYHLHLTAFFSPGPEYRIPRFFVPVGGEWLDPLALFKEPPLRSAEIVNLPGDQKTVRFPYKTTGGKLVPQGTKVIWPLACEAR